MNVPYHNRSSEYLWTLQSEPASSYFIYAICYNTNRVYMNVPYHNRSSEYQSEPASSPSEEVQDYHFSMKVYAKTMHRIMQ